MSINKLVSIDNVIINLIDDLALDHTKHTAMFKNWAVIAEKKIGSYYQYKRKHCVLTISNCIAELPQDATVLEIALMGDYGTDCGDLYNKVNSFVGNISFTGTDAGFLVVDLPSQTSTTNCYNTVPYHIQDNNLIFDRNLDGQKVTIQYLGLETDCDGVPMIGENHIEAIGEYCMYKFRKRRVKNSNDIGLYRDHLAMWKELCLCARADDAQTTDSDQRQLSDMLNNPRSGRGLLLVPSGIGYGTY